MNLSSRGEATTAILLIIVLLGGGAWGLSKTRWFSGESKRADKSSKTTTELVAAVDVQSAKAASVLTVIGQTNTEAPDSPQKRVINRMVPIGLSFLQPPDQTFIVELNKIKIAELEGRLAQADRMTAVVMQEAAEARKETNRALGAKARSDAALQEAAAELRGAEQQQFYLMIFAGAVGVLYVWTKFSHVSPLSLSRAVRDIREGTGETDPAIAALDGATTPFQQANVALTHWFRKKLSKLTS